MPWLWIAFLLCPFKLSKKRETGTSQLKIRSFHYHTEKQKKNKLNCNTYNTMIQKTSLRFPINVLHKITSAHESG